MSTQIQDWIKFWFRRNDREFAEQVEREREQDQKLVEACLQKLWRRCRFDQQRHGRDQFPVGAFFNSIDSFGDRFPVSPDTYEVLDLIETPLGTCVDRPRVLRRVPDRRREHCGHMPDSVIVVKKITYERHTPDCPAIREVASR
jgi:hypothetical protein